MTVNTVSLTLVLLLWGSLSLLTSASPPSISSSASQVSVSIGKSASFTCTVRHLGGHRVAWIKSDTKAILAIHDHVITNNEKISVHHDYKDTWTLLVRDVRHEDAGTYMCQINSEPVIHSSIELVVVSPPRILDSPSTLDVSVGETVTAECLAEGNPKPEIAWKRRRGSELVDLEINGPKLRVKAATEKDMGLYVCIANNGVPPAQSKTLTINVNFAPRVRVRSAVLGAPMGGRVRLQCDIEAFPRPMVYWASHRDEFVVSDGERVRVDERRLSDYRLMLTLSIHEVVKEDFGIYMCVAKNTIGRANGTASLYQTRQVPPRTSPRPSWSSSGSVSTVKSVATTDTTLSVSKEYEFHDQLDELSMMESELDVFNNVLDVHNDALRSHDIPRFSLPFLLIISACS